jgi:hypothetical protein
VLVTPSKQQQLEVQEVEIMVMSKDAAVDWLQQWGTTITFGSEMPFPAPLQCDPVDDGVRIAVINASRGTVTSIGELYLEVDDERWHEEGVASVVVTRVSISPDSPLPGEGAVLKALQNALKCDPALQVRAGHIAPPSSGVGIWHSAQGIEH